MSIPSLRQQMINEALDYHMNMNHVVFNRERIQAGYEGWSQEFDKSQGDMIIEATIRQKISDIMTSIQKLIQATGYTEPTKVGKGSLRSNPSGHKSGRPVHVGGVLPGDLERIARQRALRELGDVYSTDEDDDDYIPEGFERSEPVPFRQTTRRRRAQVVEGEDDEDITTDEEDDVEERKQITRYEMKTPPFRYNLESEDEDEEPAPITSNVAQLSVDGEPTAPGTLGKTAPGDITRSLMKSRDMVMSAVSSIITGYNGLVDYINLQNRQKPFKQRDVSSIDGLVKQLVDPLKSALAASSRMLESDTREAERDYIKVYNVISDMIKKILTGMPFIKVDIAMLNERIPLKYEYILSKEYDSKKQGNQQYLKSLEDMVKKEMTSLEKMPEQTPLEQEAKAVMRQQLNRQLEQLVDAGLMTDSRAREIVRGIKVSFGPPSGKPAIGLPEFMAQPRKPRTKPEGPGFVEVVDEEERKGPVEEGEEKAGEGSGLKPNRKKGGHVHKPEKFGDEQELEPYLTKHLRPSKYRKDVPPIESSSEESSGEEGSGSDMEINDMRLGKGKSERKARKQKEDVKAIANLPKAEAMVLIEKKRGGAKKKTEKAKVKPALQNDKADIDLWFM
jgi:hypothetical protein